MGGACFIPIMTKWKAVLLALRNPDAEVGIFFLSHAHMHEYRADQRLAAQTHGALHELLDMCTPGTLKKCASSWKTDVSAADRAVSAKAKKAALVMQLENDIDSGRLTLADVDRVKPMVLYELEQRSRKRKRSSEIKEQKRLRREAQAVKDKALRECIEANCLALLSETRLVALEIGVRLRQHEYDPQERAHCPLRIALFATVQIEPLRGDARVPALRPRWSTLRNATAVPGPAVQDPDDVDEEGRPNRFAPAYPLTERQSDEALKYGIPNAAQARSFQPCKPAAKRGWLSMWSPRLDICYINTEDYSEGIRWPLPSEFPRQRLIDVRVDVRMTVLLGFLAQVFPLDLVPDICAYACGHFDEEPVSPPPAKRLKSNRP